METTTKYSTTAGIFDDDPIVATVNTLLENKNFHLIEHMIDRDDNIWGQETGENIAKIARTLLYHLRTDHANNA